MEFRSGSASGGGGAALEFVERVGLSAFDFTIGSFTLDNTVRSLDVSSVVPADAVRVVLRVNASTTGTGRPFTFCGPNGSTVYDVSGVNTQVTGVIAEAQIEVPVDGTQTIKYLADSALTVASIAILGYWKPAA